jgi:hypothetical protein
VLIHQELPATCAAVLHSPVRSSIPTFLHVRFNPSRCRCDDRHVVNVVLRVVRKEGVSVGWFSGHSNDVGETDYVEPREICQCRRKALKQADGDPKQRMFQTVEVANHGPKCKRSAFYSKATAPARPRTAAPSRPCWPGWTGAAAPVKSETEEETVGVETLPVGAWIWREERLANAHVHAE